MRCRFIVVLGLAVLGACVNTKPLAASGDGCLIDSDCTSPLVCAFRRCHVRCTDDRDCRDVPEIQQCIPADPAPYRVCAIPKDFAPDVLTAGCVRNSDCPSTLTCFADGQCRPPCLQDRDCLGDRVCRSNVCAKPEEMLDGGTSGTQCLRNTDCPDPNQRCLRGTCDFECRAAVDCPPSFKCRMPERVCEPAPPDGGGVPGFGQPCFQSGNCTNLGLVCKAGYCVFECTDIRDCDRLVSDCCRDNHCLRGPACTNPTPPDAGPIDAGVGCHNDFECGDGVFCNGAERCVGGACIGAFRDVCDDSNPCTRDDCNETGRFCDNVETGPSDVDGDGHVAKSCGGTADDCDDTNRDVYPGAIERCDGIDNNCNGTVDEGTWYERPNSRSSVSATNVYDPAVAVPRAVRIGNEVKVVVAGDGTSGALDGYRLDGTDLSLLSGPIAVVRSATAWARCLDVSGQRVFFGRLFTNGSTLLATAGIGSAPADAFNCCPSLNGTWTLESKLARTGADFVGPDAGTLFSGGQNMGCIYQPTANAFTETTAAFISARNRWQIFFNDDHETTSPNYYYTARLDPATGQLTAMRRLFESPAFYAELAPYVSSGPLAVEVPGGVFVAWSQAGITGSAQYGYLHVRYALYDPDLNAPLWGPLAIGGSSGGNSAVLRSLVLDGNDVLLSAVRQSGSSGPIEVTRISPATGAVLGARTTDVTTSAPPFAFPRNQALRLAAFGAYPVTALSGRGIAAAGLTNTGMRFGWARADLDAGYTSVDSPLPLPRPIDPGLELVPVSDRRVGVLWVQGLPDGGPGPMMRTLFECGP